MLLSSNWVNLAINGPKNDFFFGLLGPGFLRLLKAFCGLVRTNVALCGLFWAWVYLHHLFFWMICGSIKKGLNDFWLHQEDIGLKTIPLCINGTTNAFFSFLSLLPLQNETWYLRHQIFPDLKNFARIW